MKVRIEFSIEQVEFLQRLCEQKAASIRTAADDWLPTNLEECLEIFEEPIALLSVVKEAAEEHDLSENQQRFVFDALQAGFDVDYSYSGRSMYGRTCPSITVDRGEFFSSSAQTRTDSMGHGKVIYSPH